MENNQPVTPQPEMQIASAPQKSNTLVMVVGGIVLLGLGLLGGYFLFGNKSNTTTPTVQTVTQVSPTGVQLPSPTVDETSNWQTYTNSKYLYSIKYPSTLKTEDRMQGQTSYDPNTLQIYKNDTNIVFTVQVLKDANTSDLKTYVENIRSQNSTNANVKIGTITETTVNNLTAYELQVTGNGRDGGWQGTDTNPHTYTYVQNQQVKYRLDYASNDPEAPQILTSFKFISEASGLNEQCLGRTNKVCATGLKCQQPPQSAADAPGTCVKE